MIQFHTKFVPVLYQQKPSEEFRPLFQVQELWLQILKEKHSIS